MDGCSLESTPDLKLCLLDRDGVLHIEESWSLADLLEVRVPERIVDDDVQDLAHGILALRHRACLRHVHLDHRGLVNQDVVGLTSVKDAPVHRFLDLSNGPDAFAAYDKRTQGAFHLTSLGLDYGLDLSRIPQLQVTDVKGVLAHLKRSSQL